MTPHQTQPYRVYYEDTDAGGVMYHANFIKFCERGRTEYLNSLGYQNNSLADRLGALFVVKALNCEYLAPARLEDMVVVSTEVVEIKNTSFIMRQNLQRGDDVLFTMDAVLVCVDKSGRPMRIPEDIRQAMA